MKEENLKCLGKGRLKPFNNKKTSSKSLVSLSHSVDVQEGDLSEYDSDNKGTRDDGEDLYKSLLNDDLSNTPSTSQEKGTMTDPSLQKKNKQSVNKSVATGNSTLHNVLQNITENKADNKVPVVMLSKPTALSKRGGKSFKNSMRKGRVKDFVLLGSLKSSSESSDSENESEKLKKDSKVTINANKPFNVLRKNTSASNTSPSKPLLHHSENELTLDYLSDSSSSLLSEPTHHSGSLQLSPDFKGFSTVKVNPKYLVPESKKALSNEKKINKKLFREKGNAEEKFSTDTKTTVLDHPYSHGNAEKVRTTSQSSDGTLVEKDYRFVSRSVFGSPTSSKNPPDIMLHNDKINILRQMSQVFNDEKNRAAPPLATKPTPDTSLLENNLIPKPTSKSDNVSTKSCDLKSSNTKLSDQKFTCQKPTNQISVDSKPIVKSQQPAKTICLLADKENHLVLKQSKTKDTKDSVNSQNDKCDEKASQEDKTPSPLSSPVHLVSSYSLDKEESIMIKSYKGTKGEDIDIVDGFTFVSFDTEEKMMKYVPTRSFGKLKRRPKRKTKMKKIVKKVKPQEKKSVAEESYDASSEMDNTVNSATDKQFEELCSSPLIPSKSSNVPPVKNVSETQEIKKDHDFELQKEKPVLSSAFASNDLDEYLTEHSQLKISFDIPKCRATEDGVTKYDENGRPLETPPPHPQPVHEKATSISSLPSNYKLKLSNDKDSSSESKFKCGTSPLVAPMPKNVATPVVPPNPTKKTSLPTPINSKASDQISGVKNHPKSLAPFQPRTKNGSRGDLFVKRGGNLLPLSSVFKKRQEGTENNEKPLEMIYIYHSGRLLTLAGSLTKVDPCNSGSIKATVALPRGHGRLIKHTQRVSSRKVKAVEINEDMAEFALSALKTPTKEGNTSPIPSLLKPVIDEKVKESNPALKPSKENILDILTAKFSLDKESKWDPSSSEPSNQFPRAGSPLDNKNGVLGSRDRESNAKKDDLSSPSKIRWNQDDILKKKESGHSTEQSKAFRKNINRFPSLSREMKRLNMNLVTYNEESNEETDSADEVIKLGPCSNSFCSLGCICDSLKCRRKSPEHCGKVDCMFQCSCAVESWKDRQIKDIPINMLSAFNAEYDKYDNLAVKEKDFKKTVVQTGSDVFLLGGEKKKRDIKIPQRFRDTNIWKSPNSSPLPWEGENDASEPVKKEESIYILPMSYKRHVREFRLNVPWYDVKGVSVWCMFHSCYDCYCLTDPNFYGDSDGEDVTVDYSSPSTVSPFGMLENPLAVDSTLPSSLTENKIVCFNLKFKALGPNPLNEKRKWTLKHWIHNANLFSARTCGYLPKTKVVKDIGETLKEGYSLPLPKPPFIMGITLKKSETAGTPRKKPDIHNDKRKKAIFFDGLGPGLTLPPVTNITDEIFAKLTDRNQCLSNIFLKTFNKIHPGLPPVVDFTGKEPTSDQLSTESRDLPKDRIEADLEEVNVKSVTGKLGNNVDGEMERENAVGEATREKSLSLYEMIKEEEKRGELELDLSPKQQGEAILVTESRFRKLINMNIIGVIGLNKAGRCIINTVKSSEDLVKMQKIQQLISTNLIDVGPNMKEIFSPSPLTEQRVRYVMIRCDASERWEIVGVVQRKNKETDQSSLPKPKRQKTSKGLTSPVQNNFNLPNMFKLKNRTDSVGNLCSDPKQADHAYSRGSDVEGSVTTTESSLDVLSQDQEKLTESNSVADLPIVTLPDVVPLLPPPPLPTQPKRPDDSLVFEKSDVDERLPRIASVLCGSDPELTRLMSSPPRATVGFPSTSDALNVRVQPQPGVAVLKHLNPSSQVLTSYVLNQPSAKVFGYNSNMPLEVDESFKSHVSKEMSGPFRGIIQSALLDHHDGKELPSNSADTHFRGTLRIDKAALPSQTHLSQPPAMNPAAKILLYPKQPSIVANGVKVALPSVGQMPPTANSSPPAIGDALSGREKIKMVLVPSTTIPGKSVLMPTFSDVPVSCTFVLRKPNEMTSHQNSSPTVLPQAIPLFSPGPINPGINSKMGLSASPGSTTFKPITCIQTSASNRPSQPIIPFKINTTPSIYGPISGAQTQSAELNLLAPETRVPVSCIQTTSGSFHFLSSGMPVPLASVHNSTRGMQVQSTGVQVVPGAIQNAKAGAQVLSGISIPSSNGDVLVHTPAVQFSSPLGYYSGTGVQTNLTTTLSSDRCLNSGAKDQTFPLVTPTSPITIINPIPSTINSLTHSSNVLTVSSSCKSTSVPTESSKGSILSTVSLNPSSIVPPNDRSMSPLIEEEVLEKQKSPNSTSPDVKCISVNKCDNCTAVDLSIRFRSIKLHWLSGTIKKDVMLNIFKMSKKINSPVSLSAKNDVTHSSFLGMYCYCETASDQVYPVLILGTRASSVLAASKMSPKEMFRSNTIKYLIKEISGELSSYTYDVRGINLIKIASKKKEAGSKVHGLGEKIPVELMRESSILLDQFHHESTSTNSKFKDEEIVISDDSDHEIETRNIKTTPVESGKSAATAYDIPDKTFFKPAERVLAPDSINVSTVKHKARTKLLSSPAKEIKSLQIHSFEEGVNLTCSSGDNCLSDKNAEEHPQKGSSKLSKLVLKVPNPFKRPLDQELRAAESNANAVKVDKLSSSTSLFETEDYEKDPLKNEPSLAIEEARSLNDLDKVMLGNQRLQEHDVTGSSLPLVEVMKGETPSSVRVVSNISTPCNNTEVESFQRGCSPQKPTLVRYSESQQPPSVQLFSPERYDKEKAHIPIPHSSSVMKREDNASSVLTTDKPSPSSSHAPEEIIDIEGNFELSLSDFIQSHLSDKGNITDKISGAKRRLVPIEKPCPLSKKPLHKRLEYAAIPNQPEKPPSKPSKSKSSLKSVPQGNTKASRNSSSSNSGGRSQSLSNPPGGSFGQEFQQVLSGAPQFWLMDNPEKHNTLERIRRKGLARMLENLYTKVNLVSNVGRLPPKHVVLKEAEKLILDQRAKDVELAKTEILLREKKTQLLNALSELLKDADEDVQHQFEQWISKNISNPTAKTKFEESWKPQNVVFEDEHILTSSCGKLVVSGADITSYFATHTAGFSPKSPAKYKSIKGLPIPRGRKFPFPLPSVSRHTPPSQTLKNKLSQLIRSPKPAKRLPLSPNFISHTFPTNESADDPDEVEENTAISPDPVENTAEDDNDPWVDFISSSGLTHPWRSAGSEEKDNSGEEMMMNLRNCDLALSDSSSSFDTAPDFTRSVELERSEDRMKLSSPPSPR